MTQPDAEVRERLRPVYSENADSLMIASQVIAINFQTVAAATATGGTEWAGPLRY